MAIPQVIMFSGAAAHVGEEEKADAYKSRSSRPIEAEVYSSSHCSYPNSPTFQSEATSTMEGSHRHQLPNCVNEKIEGKPQSALQWNASEQEIRKWGLQILEQLINLQLQGKVLRNFELENVVLVDNSAVIETAGIIYSENSTHSGNLLNTPMIGWSNRAPEELDSELFDRWKSTVWHFGVVMYRLLTRKHPFPQKSSSELLEIQRQGLQFLEIQVSLPAKALLLDLLQCDLETRLTLIEAKNHLFFAEYSDDEFICLDEGSHNIGEYVWESRNEQHEATLEKLKQSCPSLALLILKVKQRKLRKTYEQNSAYLQYKEKKPSELDAIESEIGRLESIHDLRDSQVDASLILKQEVEFRLLRAIRTRETTSAQGLLEEAMCMLTVDSGYEGYDEMRKVCDRLNRHIRAHYITL